MRTRCPHCDTVFRITPEQLRARAGKVRCGRCRGVFNALETLIAEPLRPATTEARKPEAPAGQSPASELVTEPRAETATPPATMPAPEPEPETVSQALPGRPAVPEPEVASPEPVTGQEAASEPGPDETPEETTQAAREAGLVAAREITEAPGYNRWAAAPLAGLSAESRHRTPWPFTLAAALFSLSLAAQLGYHFRTEIIQRLPGAEAVFGALGIDTPLPRQPDLVSIETSDLQSDNTRGLLVLQATLRNRAPYPQAWPALELTLTDAQDAVLARRVMHAPDYLPATADPALFAANGEIAIRLWIEARNLPAAGYRLYVFYP